MSTSFTVTDSDIVTEALEVLGVLKQGQAPQTNDFTTCNRSFNMMLQAWAKKGWWLFQYRWQPITLALNTASYTIGPTGVIVSDRPLRIADAYLRNNNLTPPIDTPSLIQWSRNDYDQQSNKGAPGIPNSFYYDPQLTNGVIYLWPVPNITGYTCYFSVQIPITVIVNTNDQIQVTQEMFETCALGLAMRVASKYGVDKDTLDDVKQRYTDAIESDADWSQEMAPTYFTPDPQMFSRR